MVVFLENIMKKPFILLPWDTYPIEGFTDVFCHHIATEDFERTAVIFPHDRIQKHWEGALTRRYADTGALFLPHSYTLFSYVDSLYIRHIQRVHGVRKPIRLYEEVILLHEIIDIYRDSLHVVHTFFSTLAPNVQYAWLHSLIRLIHTCFMEYKEPHELTEIGRAHV